VENGHFSSPLDKQLLFLSLRNTWTIANQLCFTYTKLDMKSNLTALMLSSIKRSEMPNSISGTTFSLRVRKRQKKAVWMSAHVMPSEWVKCASIMLPNTLTT